MTTKQLLAMDSEAIQKVITDFKQQQDHTSRL
jgi:hypothetical protein